jgi:hypothetical protein
MRHILNLTFLGMAASSFLTAGNRATGLGAPEIDPASAVSALALVAGIVAVVRSRRKRVDLPR